MLVWGSEEIRSSSPGFHPKPSSLLLRLCHRFFDQQTDLQPSDLAILCFFITPLLLLTVSACVPPRRRLRVVAEIAPERARVSRGMEGWFAREVDEGLLAGWILQIL